MKVINTIKELNPRIKIQLIITVIFTIPIMIITPVFAWFTSQKKAAEMYKIEYPNSLYINAAHREDRVYFNLDELNLDEYYLGEDGRPKNYNDDPEGPPEYHKKTYKLYAFSVSGEGTNKYTLQLAHTNNNRLTYTIYEANQTDVKPSGTESIDYVYYERHMGVGDNTENPYTFTDDLTVKDAYYTIVSEVSGTIMNQDTTDAILALKDINDYYYQKTYGEENTNVQDYSVPTYWQANVTLSGSDIDRNTKRFHKYYIVKVEWTGNHKNTKETDLLYISVKRN